MSKHARKRRARARATARRLNRNIIAVRSPLRSAYGAWKAAQILKKIESAAQRQVTAHPLEEE